MFQVPDELLDAMVCDSCHKFLSVGPVKVYPDKTKKCGRCSRDGDKGAISQYELIAEQGLFNYAEAADHESRCNSRRYMCPICLDTTEIPSFLLIKHFKANHSDHFLDSPSFKVNVTVPCTKTYLYRVKDNIFFIECKITSVDVIGLNIIFLGRQEGAQHMKQRFTVQYIEDTTPIETEMKICDFFGSVNTKDFLIETRKSERNLVRVDFHLEIDILEVYSLAGTNSSRQLKKILGLPRNLSLAEEFQKDHPEFTVSSKLNSVLVKNKKGGTSEYFTECCNCKVHILGGLYTYHTFIKLGSRKHHYICFLCYIYYNQSVRRNLSMEEKLYPFLHYSCIWRFWGCSESNSGEYMDLHELFCSHQPSRACPVPQCIYRGKYLELKDHLKNIHAAQLERGPYRYIPEHLPANSSEKWYIWTKYDFVSMEVSRNGSEHVMRIVPVAEKASGSPQPKVLIIDRTWEFLKLLTTEEPCHISIQDTVHIYPFFGE
ncbi:hypothetical protein JTB14_032167 [Gonioctena quinquepunctata]|nr:hypothetical protein JTB14_032167 [Gonioctena quinquepunctata]